MNFKRKILLSVVILFVMLTILYIADLPIKLIWMMVAVYAASMLLLVLMVRYKNRKAPYRDDERAISVAYKADSITLRIMLVLFVLASFVMMAFNITINVPLKHLLLYFFYFGLLLKFILYKVISRIS